MPTLTQETTHRTEHFRAADWNGWQDSWCCENCEREVDPEHPHRIGECKTLGQCPGCGRYGDAGKTCFRPCYAERGQMEECGVFT